MGQRGRRKACRQLSQEFERAKRSKPSRTLCCTLVNRTHFRSKHIARSIAGLDELKQRNESVSPPISVSPIIQIVVSVILMPIAMSIPVSP